MESDKQQLELGRFYHYPTESLSMNVKCLIKAAHLKACTFQHKIKMQVAVMRGGDFMCKLNGR